MQKEKLVPAIRFKGFSEEWKANRLSSYLNVVVKRNEQLRYSQNEVLSVSKDSGVINQIKYLGRSYAGSDLRNYKILELSHIVYTKSPLNETPFGIIKTNNYEQGIVSTLYATYEPSSACHSNFVEHYFSKYDRLNNYLYPLVNKGAKNTLLISDEIALGGRVVFPSFDEQQEISDLLDNLALLIHSQELKLEKLQTIKQSLLNKMFAPYDRKIPEIRFKGFKEEWKEFKLGNIGIFNSNGVDKIYREKDNVVHMVNYMDVYNKIAITSNNIDSFMITTANNSELLKNNLIKGDILFTPSSETIDDIGHTLVVQETIPNLVYSYHLVRFRPNSEEFWESFANYCLDQKRLCAQYMLRAQGVQRFVLNREHFNSLSAVKPSISEQKKINDLLSSFDSYIKSQEQKLEKLNNIKQALLEKMFC
ncbi:restriction endonuclease subunit S [Mycoplasma sp. VS42A]|uniref:restriction endonuclease subunit S n=1 Tax=Mycoplasma sp. VS42A TaxID=3398774 RepID=UPI003A869304